MDPIQTIGDSFGKVGDLFSGFASRVERGITSMFGSSNERRVRNIGFARDKDGTSRTVPGSILDRVNQLEATYKAQNDDELAQTSARLRDRLKAGQTLDDVLPDAFAAAREAGRRFLKMRHYDVQLVGGTVLHRGMIAEMVTGEGKTLVATLPTYLNALAGSVHVVTVNDYLARRDMEWMAPLYMGLGLTVDCIQSGMDGLAKQRAYQCDITYGTNNEFGFDYLRDNMKPAARGDGRYPDWRQQVQGPLNFALVDEIDNILIDEARTPLIISGEAHGDPGQYQVANQIALQLVKDQHFEVKEKEHTCHLTDEGIRQAEKLAQVESFYTAGNMHWPHLIDNALKAHFLYKRDVHYVVEPRRENGRMVGTVIIIDEFTGRKMEGRQWSDGLHQAVECKEGVPIKKETQTLATITLQNYFKLYKKLAGMTGTAMTEADEFLKIYKLDVISVPTNRPSQRLQYTDMIYRTEHEKWDAVLQEIREVHGTGRPVLVGTVSIEKSEHLSSMLKRYNISHSLLNAKFHEREAEIISQAGRSGAVTISTNMAGRGTDIVLGGNPEQIAWEELSKLYASRLDVPKSVWDQKTREVALAEGMEEDGRKVAELGGLHVVGTERHDSRRIDLQLRGRAGRQGDPGSSRFFVSLEDDLMRKFMGDWVKNLLTTLGMQEGEAIESPMVSRRIEAAQKKVEERHFEMRKHLLEYDEVMDEQRKRVYSYRQAILEGTNCRNLVIGMIERQIERWSEHFLDRNYRWQTIAEWCSQVHHLEIDAHDIRDMQRDQLLQFIRDEAMSQAEDELAERIEENLPLSDDEGDWNWNALSQWVNVNYSLTTSVDELKTVGRDSLLIHLNRLAAVSIENYDLRAIDTFIRADWNAVSFATWLNQQYTLNIDPAEFESLEPWDARDLATERVRQLYREKDIRYPVDAGFVGFLIPGRNGQSDQIDGDGLAAWANGRFGLQISTGELTDAASFEERLLKASESFLARGDSINQIDERLDTVFGAQDGEPTRQVDTNALSGLVEWANKSFGAELTREGLESASRNDVRQAVFAAYDRRFRPELSHTERTFILELLDTAWKDHLYYMDHLRSGVGLVGYAQKDPKVEYRREGMRAFGEMWDRIGQQVTVAIFRAERESPEFVGGLWQISQVTHESVPNTAQAAAQPDPVPMSDEAPPPGTEPGSTPVAVEPIRNFGPRVGRNDPCTCGSGKKYKKCCGRDS